MGRDSEREALGSGDSVDIEVHGPKGGDRGEEGEGEGA